jgi:hypothetical protein
MIGVGLSTAIVLDATIVRMENAEVPPRSEAVLAGTSRANSR